MMECVELNFRVLRKPKFHYNEKVRTHDGGIGTVIGSVSVHNLYLVEFNTGKSLWFYSSALEKVENETPPT